VRLHKSQHNFKKDKRQKNDKSTSPDPLMLLHVVSIICSDQELKLRTHVQSKAWEILVPVNTFMCRCRTNFNQWARLLNDMKKKILKMRIANESGKLYVKLDKWFKPTLTSQLVIYESL